LIGTTFHSERFSMILMGAHGKFKKLTQESLFLR
jgi:hypothetical protein